MKVLGMRRDDLFGLALVLPAMALVLSFIVYPVGEVIRMSFTNTNLLTRRADFVGLQSYQRVLEDPLFLMVLKNTAIWVFLGTALALILGLAIGYFISFDWGINRLLRAGILIPWILPVVVAVAAWRWMYHAEMGVLNDLLKKAGLIEKGISWLGDPALVMYALSAIATWRHLPFAALIVSAAIQGIPNGLLEAATIDGANGWQKFRYIIMPHLAYPLVVIGVMNLIWNMNDLTTVWGSTRGGPANSSEILSTFIYSMGFNSFRFGLSSALSVINFVILLGLSVAYLVILRGAWRMEER
ncbi:MAG: sugar ABC transporter permease [Chloroflexi bacterium]|nr:sugar ABC transporter permease [Chloroflexota bacterium]